LREEFPTLTGKVLEEAKKVYGERLVTLAVFGSVGRGTPGPHSDVDLLVVAEPLPDGRIRRVEEFDAVEQALEEDLRRLDSRGIYTRLSPVFKTREEVRRGSPLFLDMIDDAVILYDREGFFTSFLRDLSSKLSTLGARRIARGGAWYWDLKPDFKKGDVIEL